MRPLVLVLTAVLTAAGAYAVVFWRNAADVRDQIKTEQAAERMLEELSYGDSRSGLAEGNRVQPGADGHSRQGRTAPTGGTVDSYEVNASTSLTEPASASEGFPAPQAGAGSSATEPPEDDAEKKQRNYTALEQTALQIASAIQRRMREGEILVRGLGTGAALLRHLGYAIGVGGEYDTPDGSFVAEIKGPDLIVVTATSEGFGNQMEVSIIGPREVDRRVRRVR